MVEYMTQEEIRQRSGMAFFEAEGRLERVQRLMRDLGRVGLSTIEDEVWVSAHARGSGSVHGGSVFGMRVIVTHALPEGEVALWSGCLKGFFRDC